MGIKFPFKESEWFDDECRVKKNDYIISFDKFNSMKSEENRIDLCNKKRAYKIYVNKKKNAYKTKKSKEIEALKKKSPRDFWKYFSKRKCVKGQNVPLGDFFNYFKTLSEGISSVPNKEADDFCRNNIPYDDPVYEELDTHVSVEKVITEINSLKKGKAYADD